jgi:branched-subunit amino acid ABC-type transport system permease component
MLDVLLVDSVIRSIQQGSLYALMALGLTLTMNILRLPNFAHAELITIGAYAALLASSLEGAGLPVMLLAAFTAAALVAVGAHVTVFRPLERQRTNLYGLLLASFVVGLVLRYALFLLVDSFNLFDARIRFPLEVWVRSSPIILTNLFFWAVPTSVMLVVVLSIFLRRTRIGREMRALAVNADLAQVIGMRVERIKLLTWILIGGLAGVAGALWGIQTTLNPMMGWLVFLSVFAVTLLGGVNSFYGTIISAYIVSLSENTVMQLLNYFLGLDFSFKAAVPFVIILGVLLLRPDGFGTAFEHKTQMEH